MSGELVCWKCGVSLADYTLPLRRLEVCRTCGAELHVCKLCRYYDTSKAKHCQEPRQQSWRMHGPGSKPDAAASAEEEARRALAELFKGAKPK